MRGSDQSTARDIADDYPSPGSPTEPIRVFVCDDYPLIREGIRAILERETDMRIVGEAASAEEAIEAIADLLPDVTIMDVALPGRDGIHATRHIKAAHPSVAVVALTRYDDLEHILQLYRSGVSAYLVKDVGPARLVETIRLVAQGTMVVHPQVAERVIHAFSPEEAVSIPEPPSHKGLSGREMEVLKLLARGLANKEIARELGISSRTVENHLSNILRKLHLNYRLQAALFAIKSGLAEEPQPDASAAVAGAPSA